MDLRERIAGLMGQAQAELTELVAIPSVADPRQYPPEECARAAVWVRDAFAGAGFSDARLAEMADGSQAVLGSRRCADPDAATVLLYAHYDVQPPLDEAEWRTPPFELTEVDGRWYGRGAADCKGNILMHLTALRALGDQVPVNLKLVVEGSEETTGRFDRVTSALEQGRLSLNVRLFADERDRRVVTGPTYQVLLTVLAAASGIAAALLLGVTSGPKITQNVSLGQLIGYNLLVVAGILGLRVLYTIFKNR